MSRLTLRPTTSCRRSRTASAAGLNVSMRPCASITTMPSTAESMTARQRASLAPQLVLELRALVRSCSTPVNFRSPLMRTSPTDRWTGTRLPSRRRPVTCRPIPMILGLSRGQVARQVAVVLFVIRRRHRHADVAANVLWPRVAEQSLGAMVEGFVRPPASMRMMPSTVVLMMASAAQSGQRPERRRARCAASAERRRRSARRSPAPVRTNSAKRTTSPYGPAPRGPEGQPQQQSDPNR